MEIPIEMLDTWDADQSIVPIQLFITHPVEGDKQKWLEDLVRSWFEVGYYGGFGGSILDVDSIEFADSYMRWIVDFHGVPDVSVALNVLQICLQHFAEMHHVDMQKIVVGWMALPV
jgi:hypothetical protein